MVKSSKRSLQYNNVTSVKLLGDFDYYTVAYSMEIKPYIVKHQYLSKVVADMNPFNRWKIEIYTMNGF